MVSTGHRGHYINVDLMGDEVTIDIKGPVLVDGYTLAVDRTARLWSDAPIAWASARIDLAIETHAHTYSSLTVGCKGCAGGVVRAVAITPDDVENLRFAEARVHGEVAAGLRSLIERAGASL